MDLSRIVNWEVNGKYLDEAKKAVEQLPEEVLGNKEITLTRNENSKEIIYSLEPLGYLRLIELPEGLSEIQFYRTNENPRENGEIRFKCQNFSYMIPALRA